MPNGLPVDPNGNVIFVTNFKKVTSFKSSGGVRITPQLGAKAFARTVVINLTKDKNFKRRDIKKSLEGEEILNDGSGFRVFQTRQGSLGLSLPIGLPIGFGIGVRVVGGVYYNTIRHVKTYKSIKKLPIVSKIPSSFEDFQNYQLYDSLSFMTSGTIAFNIGVKLGPAGLGSSTFAEGDWVTTVEKTSPVHVKAEL